MNVTRLGYTLLLLNRLFWTIAGVELLLSFPLRLVFFTAGAVERNNSLTEITAALLCSSQVKSGSLSVLLIVLGPNPNGLRVLGDILAETGDMKVEECVAVSAIGEPDTGPEAEKQSDV